MGEIETLRVLLNERLCAAAEEILAVFGRTIAQYQQEIHELRHKHTETPISPLSAAWINNLCDDDDDQPQCDEDQPQIRDHREIKLEYDADGQVCGTSQPSSDLQLASPQPSEDTEDSEDYSRNADESPPRGYPSRKRRKAKTQGPPLGAAPESPARSPEEEHAETLGLVSPASSRCRVCGASFLKKGTFMRHVQVHASECGVCGKHLEPMESLDVHLQTHQTMEGPDLHLQTHQTMEGPDLHLQTHQTMESRDLHLQTHQTMESRDVHLQTMEGPDLHLQTMEGPDLHLQTMEGPDLHLQTQRSCDFCGKHFEDVMDLERHVRTHTGQKALDCSVCGKGFSNREALVKHMGAAHGGEAGRTFRCDVCNQAFTLGGNLKQHMKIHTGERPHGCSFCGKTFRLRATLARHVKSHTGEKPHSCAYCGKGFVEKGNLKVHMRTHTGETPYRCCVCGKRFKQLSCFYKHACHRAAQHGDRVLPYYTKDDQ